MEDRCLPLKALCLCQDRISQALSSLAFTETWKMDENRKRAEELGLLSFETAVWKHLDFGAFPESHNSRLIHLCVYLRIANTFWNTFWPFAKMIEVVDNICKRRPGYRTCARAACFWRPSWVIFAGPWWAVWTPDSRKNFNSSNARVRTVFKTGGRVPCGGGGWGTLESCSGM